MSNFFFSYIAGAFAINPARYISFGKTTETICSSIALVRITARLCIYAYVEPICAGILMSAGGSKLVWWLDPTGAIIVGTPLVPYCQRFDGVSIRSPPVL